MFTPIPVTTLSNGCRFDLCYTRQVDRELISDALSIKFVLEGEAMYHFSKKDYKVKTQQFLVLNNQRCRVVIDSASSLKGFCINIPYKLLDEILLAMDNTSISKQHFIDYLDKNYFFEGVNKAENSPLGIYLQCLAQTLATSYIERSQLHTEEQFLRMAELAVAGQLKTYSEFSAITTSNAALQKDTYRRLLAARSYMDANLAQDIHMEEVAGIAQLSEYYFYKLFKTTFKCTPYHYLLERRLELSKQLLKKGMSVSYVAYETGFADVYVFSKAFKRQEHITPTQYREAISKK